MTELNADEIIDFLNEELKKKVKSLLEEYLLGDEKVYDLELSIAIEENTEDVRKVERYATMLKEKGKCCRLCKIHFSDEPYPGCPECKEPMPFYQGEIENEKYRYKNFKPLYTIEDFK